MKSLGGAVLADDMMRIEVDPTAARILPSFPASLSLLCPWPRTAGCVVQVTHSAQRSLYRQNFEDILRCLLKMVHCGQVDLWSDTLWPALACLSSLWV